MKVLAFLAAAALVAMPGCAHNAVDADPGTFTLPASKLRFDATAADSATLAADGKACEQLADSLGPALHPGARQAKETTMGSVVGGVEYALSGASGLAGAALGALGGALGSGLIGPRYDVPTYESVVRNCMNAKGHRALN